MYQLWGGGAPFAPTEDPDVLLDSAGATVTLCGNTRQILREIRTQERWRAIDAKVAYVSCTDEPSWAYQLMKWLVAADGKPLSKCIDPDLIEISYADKSSQFESLNRKTGIAFEKMVFFDNEIWNINSVGRLGVKCYHTPNGMTREDWERCLEEFGIN